MTLTRALTIVLVFVGLASPVTAQDRTHITSGSSLPANCTVGDVFMKTGASAGVYACLSTDTWTASGGGGTPGGSSGDLQVNNSGSFGGYAGDSGTANQVVTAISAAGVLTTSQVTNGMLAGSIAASKLIGTDITTVGTITTGTWNGTKIDVTHGGTNLTSGTSGGVLAFTGSGTLASSGALTANLPVIGGGAGAVPTVGTVTGNTTKFATSTGTLTSGNCIKADANGNLVDSGGACGGSGSPGGSDTQVQFNDSSSFGGSSGLTYNKTSHVLTASGAISGAGYVNAYVTKTTTYTASATDGVIECLSNAFTINLPTASGITGRIYTIKNLQTANTCTIDPNSSETIDGAATAGVVGGALTIISDGTNWRSIGAAGLPISAVAQGDLIYGSATNVLSLLNKTGSTAILGNGGTSNNPAWQTTIALPMLYHFTAGNCQNTTASVAFDMPTTLGATATCQGAAAGGHAVMGTAKFVNTEVDEVQGHFALPSDWTGAVDLTLHWNAASTSSGDVVWQVKVGCAATGEAPSTISFNNTAFAAVANQTGATLRMNVSTKTGLTTTGCSAGETAWFIIYRDTAASGDTLDQDVQLIDAVFTIRRAITIGG